jgi:hypothetical protein
MIKNILMMKRHLMEFSYTVKFFLIKSKLKAKIFNIYHRILAYEFFFCYIYFKKLKNLIKEDEN